MSVKASSPDFRRLFENFPGLCIVVLPDLTVAAVTDEYLRATLSRREDLVGRNIFDSFPENPDDHGTHSMANVRRSIEKVFQTGQPDVLPIQKYDVQRPAEEGGGYEEKYWKISSAPGAGNGETVPYVMHYVEDITEQVRLQQKEIRQNEANVELKNRASRIELKRKKAQNALEDARLRLEAALEAGEIGTWTWDVVQNRVSADENLARFFSVSKKHASGGKIENYIASIHPDDRERVGNLISDALQNHTSYNTEYRLIKPGGGIRWVVARGKVLRDKAGRAIQLPGVVIDITDRKNFEEDLRKSERSLKFALDAGKLGSVELILATGQMICSERYLANIGLPPKTDLSFDTLISMIHPDDRERVRQAVEESIANRTDYEIEYRIIRADGGMAWIFARGRCLYDEQGKPLTVNGVTLDITTRKETEEALRKSQERLKLILDTSQLGLWYCDLPFDVLNWSNLTKEHFWLPPDAAVTINDFYNIIHADDRENTRREIDNSIEEQTQYDVEYRTVNPQGNRIKWIRAIGRGFYDENNNPYRFDGITIDITEDKMIQSEREHLLLSEKNARAEAENANRLKDEFLATLSHELRTPLSSILGWSRLLREGKIEGKEIRQRALETIERNAKSQSQLIEDILDVSRIISGKLRLDIQPVELASIIEMAIDSVRPAAEAKGIRLQRVIDTKAMISGDADRLQQIVWNLLSNSIKFTPKDGRVQIKLERVNSHVEITVADSGIGIEPETLPYIFERFRQSDSSTTRKHGGLGLGLAIVRHLVELHGGTVQAASEGLGQGTVFSVILPLVALRSKKLPFNTETAQDIHPAGETDVSFNCPPELENLRILLVDDEADTREVLAYIFQSCLAQVKEASSVDEALEAIRAGEYDVLVSDIGMPGRDGYDLIKKVRGLPASQGGRIPAVALTAYARIEDRLNALSAGFQMHIPKPVEPAELLAVVASLAKR